MCFFLFFSFSLSITTIVVTDSPSLELSHALPNSPVAIRLSPNRHHLFLDSDVAAKPNKLAPTVEECCIIVSCCVLNEWKEMIGWDMERGVRERERKKEDHSQRPERGDFWTSRGPGRASPLLMDDELVVRLPKGHSWRSSLFNCERPNNNTQKLM